MSCCCPVCGSVVAELQFTIISERGLVVRGDIQVHLTPLEMAFFKELVRLHPRVLNKSRYFDLFYQLSDAEVEPKIMDVVACKVRRKVKPMGVSIEAVWGTGYWLKCVGPPPVDISDEDRKGAV